MNVDVDIAKGFNGNILTINIDGIGRMIRFRSGGTCSLPRTFTASPAGGVYVTGLYDPVEVTGVATCSKDLYEALADMFYNRNNAVITSAVHETHSTIDRMIVEKSFKNCRIASAPQISVEENGGEITFNVSFSLNDYIGEEVKEL